MDKLNLTFSIAGASGYTYDCFNDTKDLYSGDLSNYVGEFDEMKCVNEGEGEIFNKLRLA